MFGKPSIDLRRGHTIVSVTTSPTQCHVLLLMCCFCSRSIRNTARFQIELSWRHTILEPTFSRSIRNFMMLWIDLRRCHAKVSVSFYWCFLFLKVRTKLISVFKPNSHDVTHHRNRHSQGRSETARCFKSIFGEATQNRVSVNDSTFSRSVRNWAVFQTLALMMSYTIKTDIFNVDQEREVVSNRASMTSKATKCMRSFVDVLYCWRSVWN